MYGLVTTLCLIWLAHWSDKHNWKLVYITFIVSYTLRDSVFVYKIGTEQELRHIAAANKSYFRF